MKLLGHFVITSRNEVCIVCTCGTTGRQYRDASLHFQVLTRIQVFSLVDLCKIVCTNFYLFFFLGILFCFVLFF